MLVALPVELITILKTPYSPSYILICLKIDYIRTSEQGKITRHSLYNHRVAFTMIHW